MPQLNFKGKQFVQNHHLAVKYHELVPHKDKSLTDKVSLHDNLIIHGDNLKALKALLPTYAGKIKCIYIDPPYNTGNEKWIYNDNVSSPMMQDWLGKVVDNEDLTRHDKWLCMMTPRLKLLRELLCEDGVIFISIDDNEQHRLRMLMDEIFGEENFVATFVWKTRQASGKQVAENNISVEHEYVLCYRKTEGITPFIGEQRNRSSYTNPDNDPRGDWAKHPLDVGSTKKERPNCFYDLVDPATGNIFHPNPNRVWAFSRDSMNKLMNEGKILFDPNGKTKPYLKKFWTELRSETKPLSTWIYKNNNGDDEVKHLEINFNTEGTKVLNEIFGEKKFDYPKPVSLIRELIKQVSNSDSIVLDSFAGSGTTAHAVLDLNKEDGGNRKFILVEMEEYADKITAERVRRVIKGYGDKKGTGGSFSYFDLGKPIEMESILSGKNLPNFMELARYVFYTATGEEFDETKIDESKNFIGESKEYEVYLFYKPDLEYLKNTALTLDRAKALGPIKNKRRLVFAPTKYLDPEYLDEFKIDFAQLPFEIYKLSK